MTPRGRDAVGADAKLTLGGQNAISANAQCAHKDRRQLFPQEPCRYCCFRRGKFRVLPGIQYTPPNQPGPSTSYSVGKQNHPESACACMERLCNLFRMFAQANQVRNQQHPLQIDPRDSRDSSGGKCLNTSHKPRAPNWLYRNR